MNLRELLLTPLDNLTFSVVDTETTGMSSDFNRVMDVGIVTVKSGEIVNKWEALINPKQEVDYWITYYTNLTDAHVKNKPTFDYYASHINNLLADTIFVGHNVGFDYSFMSSEMKRAGHVFDYPKLCTVLLGRKLLPQLANAHLDALADYYDIKISARHRALPDAEATAIVLLEFIRLAKQQFSAKTFFDLERLQHIKVDKMESLPPPAKGSLFA